LRHCLSRDVTAIRRAPLAQPLTASMQNAYYKIFVGPVVHSLSLDELQIIPKAYIGGTGLDYSELLVVSQFTSP